MKLTDTVQYVAVSLALVVSFVTAGGSSRMALFCEDGSFYTASDDKGELRPCFYVDDYYDGYKNGYDCSLYAWTGVSDFPMYDDFCFAETYFINCDYHHYEYAGICYYDPHYGVWKWKSGWCDKGSEAVSTLVEDGCHRRLKGKPEGTPGRGPPIDPLGKVPETEVVEIDGQMVVTLLP